MNSKNSSISTPAFILAPNGGEKLKVLVVGIGGTGSLLIQLLARMDMAIQSFGHPGFSIVATDPDIVSEANIGRQLFPSSDLGMSKAESLRSRVNAFYGTNYIGVTGKHDDIRISSMNYPMVIFSCIDNISGRRELNQKYCKGNGHKPSMMMIDCGNSHDFGQVFIYVRKRDDDIHHYGTIFSKKFKGMRDKKHEPSCSLAMALGRQDLHINSFIANLASDVLWKALRTGYVRHSEIYLNLTTLEITKKCMN